MALVCVSTQAPLQSVAPTGQDELHRPLVQVWPAAHAAAQAPQLAASVAVFTQRPPQSAWPDGHTHAPAEQLWPAAQTRPQAPQLEASVAVLTQREPHAVCPVGQPHDPPTQD